MKTIIILLKNAGNNMRTDAIIKREGMQAIFEW
jgi:hypothetical protein